MGIGAIGILSGCTSNQESKPTQTSIPPDSDADGVKDSEDDYPDNYYMAERKKHIDKTITLTAGDYETIRLNADNGPHTLEYDYIVLGDGTIDTYLIPRDEYQKYRDGDKFQYYSALSSANLAEGSGSNVISEGDYLLIIDYTERGTIPKKASVEIDLVLDFAKPAQDFETDQTTDGG